jgi:DNA topoisomerase-2
LTSDKSIEQRYKKLTDVEHVLLRPGMYVGSTKLREEDVHLLEDGALVQRRVTYNPAFLKIFDEIVSNSADEHRRNPKLDRIRVTVTTSCLGEPLNTVDVWDNGGIPVVKHAEHDEWVPELIFSNLKAGSNFDDDESRLVAGTNGVGSTLTNIFSRTFCVRTSDGANEFKQVFAKNMTERGQAEVSPTRKAGYTDITYQPDLARFGMTGIDPDHVQMMRKRCLELAACNPALTVSFSVDGGVAEEFSFPSFQAYCALYSGSVLYEEAGRWRVGIAASEGSFTQVSFVNSVETRDGGTHVEYVTSQVVAWLRERIRKKHKLDLKPAEIRNHFTVFVQADIVNPAFSSQTKEKLITDVKEFGSKYEPSEKLLKAVFASEVVGRILDWAQEKALADERKQLRDLNKSIAKEKVLKLIDARATVGRHRCSLAIFEGDSAKSAFLTYRDPQFQGAFPLRGKVLNVAELPATRIVQNQEIKDLLTAIGLKMGEEPKDLRYGKILIYADADPDGDSITGLLVNFFGRFWPELFQKERVFRVMTPLVVAQKGTETVCFYTSAEFAAWSADRKDLSKWDVAYKKGLAALEDSEYRDIIQSPRMFALVPGADMRSVLDCWFAGDVKQRKSKILRESEVSDG